MPRTALAALLLLLLPYEARSADVPEPGINLPVRAYIRVPLSEASAAAALDRAAGLLGEAGVRVSWRVCRPDSPTPACDARLGDGELTIQVLPRKRRSDGALGLAITGMDGRIGRYAQAFWGGVEAVAQKTSAPAATVLGHVIAHELGHLLLGEASHSRRGLMRADWSAGDLRAMRAGKLGFDRLQGIQMRKMLARRDPSMTLALAESPK